MRILHINCNYIASTLHQAMIEHLDCLDVINKVFVPTYNPKSAVIKPNSNVCVSKCFHKWDRLLFDYKQQKIYKNIQKEYEITDFDCIHAYTLFTDGNCAMKLSKKYNIPYIVAIRNTDVNTFFKKLPYLRNRGIQIMEKASAICFLSKSYKQRVFDQYVPDSQRQELEDKSYIIPNGIDDFWIEHEVDERHKIHHPVRLIYTGSIDKNKNIKGIIKAIECLKNMGLEAELTVVGAIHDEKIFRNICRYDYVHYHEAVPKEKLINFYRENDIFIMPSFTESFGLVYAEAISQGLPVIYTKGEGFDGQYPEGLVGYHVNSRDSKDIALNVKKICERYMEIPKSVHMIIKKFDWANIVQQYKKIYESLCKN